MSRRMRDDLLRLARSLKFGHATASLLVGRLSASTRQNTLAHISPAHSENINFFGSIDVDIDAELTQLGPTGYRPLRVSDTLF
jgi:Tn3 transposase DDE domain